MVNIIKQRKQIRLKNYDYSLPGTYFVTICTFERVCLFGNINDCKMQLNDYGHVVHDEWLKTEKLRLNVKLDEFIVMPNHIHGIIRIINDCRGTARRAPTTVEHFGKPTVGSIPTITRSFKSAVTKRINESRQTPTGHVWQRNYYERIIRNDQELYKIKQYIWDNIKNWKHDSNNISGEIP